MRIAGSALVLGAALAAPAYAGPSFLTSRPPAQLESGRSCGTPYLTIYTPNQLVEQRQQTTLSSYYVTWTQGRYNCYQNYTAVASTWSANGGRIHPINGGTQATFAANKVGAYTIYAQYQSS